MSNASAVDAGAPRYPTATQRDVEPPVFEVEQLHRCASTDEADPCIITPPAPSPLLTGGPAAPKPEPAPPANTASAADRAKALAQWRRPLNVYNELVDNKTRYPDIVGEPQERRRRDGGLSEATVPIYTPGLAASTTLTLTKDGLQRSDGGLIQTKEELATFLAERHLRAYAALGTPGLLRGLGLSEIPDEQKAPNLEIVRVTSQRELERHAESMASRFSGVVEWTNIDGRTALVIRDSKVAQRSEPRGYVVDGNSYVRVMGPGEPIYTPAELAEYLAEMAESPGTPEAAKVDQAQAAPAAQGRLAGTNRPAWDDNPY